MEKISYKQKLIDITTFIFDFDGVISDGDITITTEGEMIRTMNVKDGYALKAALMNGFKVCIISGGTNEGVRKRLHDLGIVDIYLGTHQKEQVLNEYLSQKEIHPEHILYMGDDIPDIPAMKKVGLPTCPQDAVPEVKAISEYISHKKGGRGCVRDVIEQVLKVQGKWMTITDASLNA
jgi:3-deoxy-D-manno-octulosonate 8-phosphate phosphatase (KDO 8-P phosphatase)